jgi:hypothetical protein
MHGRKNIKKREKAFLLWEHRRVFVCPTNWYVDLKLRNSKQFCSQVKKKKIINVLIYFDHYSTKFVTTCWAVLQKCFSCSPPDLNSLVTFFSPIFVYMYNNHWHRVITQLQLINIIVIIIIIHKRYFSRLKNSADLAVWRRRLKEIAQVCT